MEKVGKVIIMCYAVQIILISALIMLNKKLIESSITINKWYVAVIFIVNFLICSIWFFQTLRKVLREISHEDYQYLFKDYPYLVNGFRFITFTFTSRVEDTISIKKIKMYIKHYYVIVCIIFFEVILMTLLFR